MEKDIPETEEVNTYFNPTLTADFNKLVVLMRETDKLLVNVAVDLQVAKPDDDTFEEFGGACLEAHEAIEEVASLVKKTKNLLKKVAEEADGEWHVTIVKKRDDLSTT